MLKKFNDDEYWFGYNAYYSRPNLIIKKAGINGDMRVKNICNNIITMPNNENSYILFEYDDAINKVVISYKGWYLPEERYLIKLDRFKKKTDKYFKLKTILENTNFIKSVEIDFNGKLFEFDLELFKLIKNEPKDKLKVYSNIKSGRGIYLLNDTYYKTKFTINKYVEIKLTKGNVILSLSKDRSDIIKRCSIELLIPSDTVLPENTVGAFINGMIKIKQKTKIFEPYVNII